MKTATQAWNRLTLNKANELAFETAGSWAPSRGVATVEAVAEALAAHGAVEVVVQFRTSADHLAADAVKFTRRLAKIAALAGYAFEPFAARVINGYTMPSVQATILRRAV